MSGVRSRRNRLVCRTGEPSTNKTVSISILGLLTLWLSNLTIFDFDSKVDYERLIEKHPDLKTYKTIKTNKGFHIWFTYDPDYKTTVDCFNDYKGVDIRNDAGIVFCPPTKYMMPNGSIVEYIDLGGTMEQPPTYLKSYIKTTPIREIQANTPVKQSDPQNVTKNEVVDKLLYLGLLDGKAQGTWDDWRNVALLCDGLQPSSTSTVFQN